MAYQGPGPGPGDGSGLTRTPRAGKERPARLPQIKRNYDLYLLLVPGLVFLLLFKYAPIYGLVIAFQDFNIFAGIGGSEWVGLAQFERLFQSPDFARVLTNTIVISLYKVVILFPIPIAIALLLNEVRLMWFKRSIQTIIYLPHFLSWVVIAGLFVNVLSPSGGIVNQVIVALGGEPIHFLMDNSVFRWVVIATDGWKEAGWNAIIFIAAIAGLDPELYEAARLDGASRLQQMLLITLPGIASTIILMLILRVGNVLEAGTQQILLLYNPTVYETGDVIGTFIYRMGLSSMEYSFSTAVGLFESLVGFALVIGGNAAAKRATGKSIW
ncbi:sugar ABC transporter permease [Paenibacillus sp. IB182496]|uniref:Sugar ABC transporter permease n=1 Tax=Paenibacillus sabuli TaxID=2772509 RepID=A0A927GSR3_9BACL|nr:ABC transporter permease subunit [Paenibacillus sabuli]MBD2846300.1 sugar ABC transporter permease [Paenibacillus sabuli]